MRYVIVCVVKGEAGDFNNNLRRELFEKFKAKSSKLPAHFTIKAPFEHNGDILDLENILEEFCNEEKLAPFDINGYSNFDKRVIYMKVNMSSEGKTIHDKLIEEISKDPYIGFKKGEGKDKIFHVTLASKNLQPIYNEVWDYVNKYKCDFKCSFDNITIYNWDNNTWNVYREFKMVKTS